MSRVIALVIFSIATLVSSINPLFADEPLESYGDTSSDNFEQAVDKDDISNNKSSEIIADDNFDKSDGGLYCPNNECNDNPSDVANGF